MSSAESKLFEDIRLPKGITPVRYDVSIKPAMVAPFIFTGRISIELNIKEKSEAIVCHSVELEIEATNVYLTRQDTPDQRFPVTKVLFDEKQEQVAFLFEDSASALASGQAQLVIEEYKGVHNDKLAGFYRSQYTSSVDGKQKFSVVTQFEATDARRALPCWDEPAFKAIFDAELVVRDNLTAVSNMPVRQRLVVPGDDGLVRIRYYPSPVMSSYLLAFVVGEFDVIGVHDPVAGVETRVFTPVGKSKQGKFALDVAEKCLRFFNDFFAIPYPLPKMDLIAIADFAAGAMENWGCVTYRETRILIDAENSSFAVKQATARTICHEIAHQWFGNYVTMEWWNSLWLNEGFARFCEHLAVDHIFPEWGMWTKFTHEVLSFALDRDSKLTSHPIEVPVSHPDEVNSIFDAISYAKGGSVLLMIYHTIGHVNFRDGVRSYLKHFAYANAVTEDLWVHLNKFAPADMDVASMMDGFVKKMGYPLVQARVSSDGKQKLALTQQRFVVSATEVPSEAMTYRWEIPMQIAFYDKDGKQLEVQKIVLPSGAKDAVEIVPTHEGAAFVDMNHNACGFYRVHLLTDAKAALSPVVLSPRICRDHPDAALTSISDTFALVEQGKLGPEAVVDLVNAFREAFADATQINYWVLAALVDGLCSFCALHSEVSYYPKVKVWLSEVFGAAYANRKSFGTDEFGLLRQQRILNVMASVAGDKTAVQDCISMLKNWEEIPPDWRGVVYNAAVRYGGVEEYEAVLAIYRKTELSEEKRRCMLALGRNPSPELMQRTLAWGVVEEKEVRSQDVYLVTSSLTSSPAGRAMLWQWLQDNWSVFHARFSSGFVKTYVLDTIIGRFRSNERADEVENFFMAENSPRAGEFTVAPVARALDGIRSAAARLSRERPFFAEKFA